MVKSNFIFDGLRWIFSLFDRIVYGLLSPILQLIFDISSLTASPGLLGDIYSRIYVILGIFMAFKLSFSFFQYIVDPESMVGKSDKGVSKLITNTIIMIIALVGLPPILFGGDNGPGLLSRAQNAFLPMLPRLLLGISEDSGVSVGNTNNGEDIDTVAELFSVTALQAFFVPVKELDTVCGAGTYDNTPPITSFEQFDDALLLKCNGVKGGKYYRYNYIFIISTIVGALFCYILLCIGIDVGIRVFKMIILELVAPIPIMSLIDPKSSKGGSFSKWLKSLISTFLDIFIKLGILYLVLTLLRLIVSNNLFGNFPDFSEQPFRASFLTLALIISLLFFAKEAPNFIRNALGLDKDAGSFNFGRAATVGAAGLAAGGSAISAAGASYHNRPEGQSKGKAFAAAGLAALTGLTTGTARAGLGLATGKKGTDIRKAQDAVNQKRLQNLQSGSSLLGRTGAKGERLLYGGTYSERMDEIYSGFDEVSKASTAIDDKLKKEAVTKGKGKISGFSMQGYRNVYDDDGKPVIDPDTNKIMKEAISGASSITSNMKTIQAEMQHTEGDYINLDGIYYKKADIAANMSSLEDMAIDDYETNYVSGTDAELENLLVNYDNARASANIKTSRPSNRAQRKQEKTEFTKGRSFLHTSSKYKSSKKNTSVIGGGKKK